MISGEAVHLFGNYGITEEALTSIILFLLITFSNGYSCYIKLIVIYQLCKLYVVI